MKNQFLAAGFLLCSVSTHCVGKTPDAAHDPCANAPALAQKYLSEDVVDWHTHTTTIKNAMACLLKEHTTLTRQLKEEKSNLAKCDGQSAHWAEKITSLLTVLEPYAQNLINIDNVDAVMKETFEQFIDGLNALTQKINQDNAQLTKGT